MNPQMCLRLTLVTLNLTTFTVQSDRDQKASESGGYSSTSTATTITTYHHTPPLPPLPCSTSRGSVQRGSQCYFRSPAPEAPLPNICNTNSPPLTKALTNRGTKTMHQRYCKTQAPSPTVEKKRSSILP